MRLLLSLSLILLLACGEDSSPPAPAQEAEQRVEYQGGTAVLQDKETYAVLNAAILENLGEYEADKVKVIPLTLAHDPEVANIIEGLDSLLSEDDIQFMLSQIDDQVYRWNCSRMVNVVCLNVDTVNAIFEKGRQVFEEDSLTKIVDAWHIFRQRFGNGGIHNYSLPIWNRDKNVVVIQHGGQGDWELGSGEVYVLLKQGKEWTLFRDKTLWVS